MIITVTLNPSLDRAIDLDRLVRGEVLRAAPARLDPGGKGVNVSRALLANGVPNTAVLPVGGEDGAHLIELLRTDKVDLLTVPVEGRTRSNITLAEPDGTVTKINEPGPSLSSQELEAVFEKVLTAAQTARWVVICGSLPAGMSIDLFSDLCRKVVAAGARLAVDTSGPALRAAAEAGANLVKPNREELAEAVGAPLATLGDVVEAAQQVRAWGAEAVLASLGSDGAVLVDADGVATGESPVSDPRSSVGAGDSLLAGFLAAGGHGVEALAEGIAWGSAAVRLPGSVMPGPADLNRSAVHIHPRPDLARPLLSQG